MGSEFQGSSWAESSSGEGKELRVPPLTRSSPRPFSLPSSCFWSKLELYSSAPHPTSTTHVCVHAHLRENSRLGPGESGKKEVLVLPCIVQLLH